MDSQLIIILGIIIVIAAVYFLYAKKKADEAAAAAAADAANAAAVASLLASAGTGADTTSGTTSGTTTTDTTSGTTTDAVDTVNEIPTSISEYTYRDYSGGSTTDGTSGSQSPANSEENRALLTYLLLLSAMRGSLSDNKGGSGGKGGSGSSDFNDDTIQVNSEIQKKVAAAAKRPILWTSSKPTSAQQAAPTKLRGYVSWNGKAWVNTKAPSGVSVAVTDPKAFSAGIDKLIKQQQVNTMSGYSRVNVPVQWPRPLMKTGAHQMPDIGEGNGYVTEVLGYAPSMLQCNDMCLAGKTCTAGYYSFNSIVPYGKSSYGKCIGYNKP